MRKAWPEAGKPVLNYSVLSYSKAQALTFTVAGQTLTLSTATALQFRSLVNTMLDQLPPTNKRAYVEGLLVGLNYNEWDDKWYALTELTRAGATLPPGR